MAGTFEGGRNARDTNYKRYGKDFYSKIGKLGGSKGAKDGVIKGFAVMKANGEIYKIRVAGAKGGAVSRRGPTKRTYNKHPERVSMEQTIIAAPVSRGGWFRRIF